ncbi:Z1 domain-containing protein [Corallococcus exercitus]|uniref:Z1 domain-containing protein n=1 Tax=Corallococcus exercitus TaxID=2316736 RepID=A0A7Y4NX20_9BACT|nr:Z1 domain-containing protein [Corallococcus exercitus]NOK38963.1 Z1 domain-containing protein [Corallococcus exercitus]
MNADIVVNMALVALPPDRVPTEDEIRNIVDRLAPIYGSDESIKAQVLSKLLTRCLVKMDTGFALVDEHIPWVNARRPDIDPYYWDRFKKWLQRQGWPAGVLSGLDRTTDEVLDLLGNPAELNTWKRRGLVMGDVQSGKTATYSALICKAADAGYGFIILLTGTIENLRQQTQARLDEGFVGFDSSEQLKRNRRDLRVGVGLIDGRRQATVFTSSSADFRSTTLDTLGMRLNSLRDPAIVVIKKHTRILENLRDWLRSYNTTTPSGLIEIPTLIIDDEADNASINTNDENKDPTRVNERIRELLTLFRQTTYVGFTATPFANIFVNPDDQDGMLGDDLFPRDFIYTLQAPTNYFGPRRIFMDDSGSGLHLRSIQDADAAIPSKHRSNFKVTALPGSLIKALHAFLVANAIRDLRGEGPSHRSMLVNVSQFTGVQSGRGPDDLGVEGLLRAELERAQTAIRNFSSLPTATALENATIAALHAAWEEEYQDCGFDWPAVQGALRKAVLPVTTIAVNQSTGPRALNYKAHKDTGLRVIAVGGNSLSRGLTLEGLVVSYFRRSTKMYDTLLQMGRWFGYRPGYEDLCRVWLPQDAIDWYGHISEATEELRSQLKQMYRLGRKPKDFGLAVRASPDSLLVTARNKMRTAREITRVISVSGEAFESVELHASAKHLLDNWSQIKSFVEAAESAPGVSEISPAGPRILRGVRRQVIADILRNFKVPETEFRFQPDAIADLLERMPAGIMEEWDVAIPKGDGEPIQLGRYRFERLKRKVRMDPPGVLEVSGAKRRVGSRGVEKAGLTAEETEQARRLAHQAELEMAAEEGRNAKLPEDINVADKFYRAVRSRPLLLIHVLEPVLAMAQADHGGVENSPGLPNLGDGALVAIGLSFPRLDADAARTLAKYKINVVKWRETFSSSIEPGDDDDFEEQP